MVEGTIAGLAAGVVARGDVDLEEVTTASKALEVHVDGQFRDLALVDVAVSKERFVGARAIWDVDTLHEVYLARVDGSEARNLTNAEGLDGHPWFSRDGKWIVFESDRTGTMEIWKINLETLEQHQLTFSGKAYSCRTPRW